MVKWLSIRLSLFALAVLSLLTGCMTENTLAKAPLLPEAPPQVQTTIPGDWTFRFLSLSEEERVRRALDASPLDEGRKDRLRAVLAQIDQGWIPEGMNESQIMNNAFCAWTAARARSLMLGLSGDSVIADGLVGDAWNFQLSIAGHGGKVVWKVGERSFDASSLARFSHTSRKF